MMQGKKRREEKKYEMGDVGRVVKPLLQSK
jgi:hypothetical protein